MGQLKGSSMSNDTRRLDLDEAHAALAKARTGSAMAVRAPRPADLSRVREEQERRHRIETRAGAFRMNVRTALGLADASGPYSALPVTSSGVLGASLCDADVCTPEPPALRHEPLPAAHKAPPLTSDTAEPARLAEAQPVEDVPVVEEPAQAEAEPDAAPRKRKKFLGIF